jgi:DNA polymerase III subunit gamma/tau
VAGDDEPSIAIADADSASNEARAPDTGAVDAQMLRRSWPQVVEALKARRRMVLYANAQVATVGTFDGGTLELIFPPGREFGARKIEQKQDDLRDVLSEMFGVSPTVRCTVREGTVLEPESDEPPASPEAAEDLLRRQFGAEVVEEE